MAHHIAIYGKGGVGKSTVAANLGAALAEMDMKVVLVGCDPKCDCTTLLHNGEPRPSVIELIASGKRVELDRVVTRGYRGIACIEVGDPFHTGECASRGIGRAFELLHELDVFGLLSPDLVLYDIPGDPGCLGFIRPIGNPQVRTALVVTSADVMSLYTANTIFRMIDRQRDGNPVASALIANGLNGPLEEALADDFAHRISSRVIGTIARSLVVKQCELYGKTVIEAAPLSNHAYVYRRLARHIIDEKVISSLPAPAPLPPNDLKKWARSWGDRIYELEHGVIRDGAGI
ncbi:MAG TPA: AAA family ATPase [Geobacteraceae bacterium]|nr:AAA family ATPase [Geobacteraceae bacterium]